MYVMDVVQSTPFALFCNLIEDRDILFQLQLSVGRACRQRTHRLCT
jgi:hypothetical protein